MRESVRREVGRERGREGVVRSCDIAAAARLRISVFSLRGREREEIGSVCGVLLC